MGPLLRLLIIVGALVIVSMVLKSIKKSRIQIEDSIFWVSFVCVIILVAVFPSIMVWLAGLFGFVSTSNFVFLIVVGILLLKVFTSSVEISRLKYRVNQLAQEVALTNKETFDKQVHSQGQNFIDRRTHTVQDTCQSTEGFRK